MLREASTNVAKHGAPGGTCNIALSTRDGRLHVEVQNQVASSPDVPRMPDSRLGIDLLEARVAALGGRLETGSRDGVWTLTAVWER